MLVSQAKVSRYSLPQKRDNITSCSIINSASFTLYYQTAIEINAIKLIFNLTTKFTKKIKILFTVQLGIMKYVATQNIHIKNLINSKLNFNHKSAYLLTLPIPLFSHTKHR